MKDTIEQAAPVAECSADAPHRVWSMEQGRQAYQADAWQDGRCSCFAFGWSEAARREEAADQTDGWQPKGESDYVCGRCSQVVTWHERFVDQFDGNTPYHKACWDDQQGEPAVAGREQAVALWERMGRTHDNRS